MDQIPPHIKKVINDQVVQVLQSKQWQLGPRTVNQKIKTEPRENTNTSDIPPEMAALMQSYEKLSPSGKQVLCENNFHITVPEVRAAKEELSIASLEYRRINRAWQLSVLKYNAMFIKLAKKLTAEDFGKILVSGKDMIEEMEEARDNDKKDVDDFWNVPLVAGEGFFIKQDE